MRDPKVAFLLIVLSAASFAQQSSTSPTTISGCLMSLNGSFILLTRSGERYILKGNQNRLFSYNGMQVQITGKPRSTKEATRHEFQVSSVKRIANVCQ